METEPLDHHGGKKSGNLFIYYYYLEDNFVFFLSNCF